ncbi:MAG: NADH-quinone oxidoreductase subunit M [Fibrobacteres bacterium]|nr:NADH-quinone oxidoreductase subunit M [Fibrobacterota bacterium]
MDALLLSTVIAIPALGALASWCAPERSDLQKRITIGIAVLMLVLTGGLFWAQSATATTGFLLRERIPLLPQWGVAWHLGMDRLSATMIFLTAIVQFAASLANAPKVRFRAYHAMFQLLFVGVYGSFLALDMVFFYCFWEIMLIPMFFLVAVWGGDDRKRAAVKFFLYTMAGSMAMLLAIFLLNVSAPRESVPMVVRAEEVRENMTTGSGGEAILYGLPVMTGAVGGQQSLVRSADIAAGRKLPLYVPLSRSFDMLHWKLLAPWWAQRQIFGIGLAGLCLGLFFVAFAVKVPSVPLHAWLPHAHVQAPTAISVVLAGILLKLGVYGLIRVAWPLFPGAVAQAAWLFGWIGAISIVWGGLAALGQTDLKRLVAYSSISHMGFCLVGLASGTAQGITGAMFQCVSHGLSASLLFLLVGVIYERAHHRRVDGFGGLAQVMPKFSALFLFSAMVGAGLPGLAGFVGELGVLLGAWSADATRLAGFVSATGVILSAAYLLWMVQRVLYGPLRHPEQSAFADLSRTELASLLPLAALSLLLGVWPSLLQDVVGPASASLWGHMAWLQGAW